MTDINIKEKIINNLKKSLEKNSLRLNSKEILLEHPNILEHGDYSTNIALILAKEKKGNPRELAEKIVSKIENDNYIEKVTVAGPGFINFYLSKKFYTDFLKNFKVKKLNLLKNKFILLEHTDPNLFKEFHIGHLMTNAIGESMGRIMSFVGGKIKQVTFQGDVGLHVAKTIWGMRNISKQRPADNADIFTKQVYLGKCYVFGEKEYGENEKAREEIIEINKKVYSQKDKEQNKLYNLGKEWSLEYFEEIYKIVGSKFDHYFLESETFSVGKKLVKENVGKIFEKSQGAIIFPGSKHGLHDRVFINSGGLPTYEAKDLGLFHKKWQKYNPDISVTVTSSEQKQYFEVVKKVAGMINPEWKEKTIHLTHGELKLSSGKMSSRKGEIVRAKEWIDELAKKIGRKMTRQKTENKEEIARKIAISAIKYQILKSSVGKDIFYDENKALDFNGNSGPYLQYTYVRARSILKKVNNLEKAIDTGKTGETNSMEKLLYRFNEAVEKSWQDRSPHHLANYLYDLSSAFNSFYAKEKILDKKNADYEYNLSLISAFAKTLKKGLNLLGIETVPWM